MAFWIMYILGVIALIVLLIMLASDLAQANENDERLFILASLAAVDYNQSAGFVTPGGGAVELNPLLGDHPSRGDMLAFGSVSMGLAWAASKILPEPWDRIVLDSAISSEKWNIEENKLVRDGKRRSIQAVPIIITVRF
jgi:hypothetical protein